MSGGSLDYVCFRVGQAADEIDSRARSPLHRAFATHLRKVSEALHDLGWVFSADYGDGDEVGAINAVLHPTAVVEQATADARKALADLDDALASLPDSPSPEQEDT